jgi:PhzF family phenazine biosynthesis protein
MLMKRPVHQSERNLPLTIVDAFTSKPVGGGNQAGVVIFPQAPTPGLCVVSGTADADAQPSASKDAADGTDTMSAWMQEIAIELGFSETAFLQPLGSGAWSLRWFTPGGEVDLCGHATLASAAALKRSGALHPNTRSVAFASRSGRLTATYSAETPTRATLDFPAEPAEPVASAEAGAITAAVGPALWPSATDAQRSGFIESVGRNRVDVVVRVTKAGFEAIARHPDAASLNAIDCRGIIVTALGDGEGG